MGHFCRRWIETSEQSVMKGFEILIVVDFVLDFL